MGRTHNAWIFLTAVLLLPVGWWLYGPIGDRLSKPEYRNDEDLYMVLFVVGGLLVLLAVTLIVTAIFRGLRQIDRLSDESFQERSRQSVQRSEAP